jgi:hypothetical protein
MITGTSGRNALAFGSSSRPRHVDVGQDQDERGILRIVDTLQRRGSRLGKRHGEPASAEIAPELLLKQHLDVRLIVDHENKEGHEAYASMTQEFSHGLESS